MSSYNFKQEAKLYLVDDPLGTPLQYNIDISTINFSQTTTEESFSTKTIQTVNYFEASKILKANPANFDFTLPVLREDDLKVVFNRLLDYQTFDLYIATEKDVFRIRNAVITNGNFIIERLRPLSLAVSGQASQVSWEGDIDQFTIPGAVQARSSNRTYNKITYLSASLGGVTSSTLNSGINSAQITIQNNINWTPNLIVGLCTTEPTTLTFPETFTIADRAFSGSIVQYLTSDTNTDLFGYSNNTSLSLSVGELIGSTIYGFEININNCIYTNKLITGEIFTQVYEWAMTENPTSLSDVITYITL